jgi:hypothetical protein
VLEVEVAYVDTVIVQQLGMDLAANVRCRAIVEIPERDSLELLTRAVVDLHRDERLNAAVVYVDYRLANSTGLAEEDASDLPAALRQAPALESAERPLIEPAEARDQLESAFLEEGTDPGWARQAERTVQEKLRGSMPDASAVRSIECRSSICRIETAHQDPGAYGQFVDSVFKSPETQIWNSSSFSTPLRSDDRGGMVIVSYLAREGEAHPPLDPSASPRGDSYVR